jgi:hypothetical protein
MVRAADMFNETVKKSSIVDLIKEWAGFKTEVEATTASMSSFAPDLDKATNKTKDQYKKFLEDMNKLAEDAEKAKATTSDPLADEQDRYEKQLAAARQYHVAKLSNEAEYQRQSEQMEQTHANMVSAITDKNFKDASEKAASLAEVNLFTKLDEIEQTRAIEQKAFEERFASLLANSETEEKMNDGIDVLAQEHANNRNAIAQAQAQTEAQITQAKWATIGNLMGQAAALMDRSNKQQFYAWKAFATGQSIINALMSFSSIMGDTQSLAMFGPIGRTVLATASLGMGLAAAAKIAATPFGGGGTGTNLGSVGSGGGGGGGGGQSTSGGGGAGTNTGNQSNVRVNLYGTNFTADQVRGLIGALNAQAGDNMTLRAQVMS